MERKKESGKKRVSVKREKGGFMKGVREGRKGKEDENKHKKDVRKRKQQRDRGT